MEIKTREQRRAETLAKIPEFTLMDDTYMTAFFNDQPELIQFVLRIIMNNEKLIVKSSRTQKPLKSIQGRSITLDVDAVDENDKEYDVEVQQENYGAKPKRARFHSSMLDSNSLVHEEDFENLPESYVIFITSKDYFKKGLPIYTINRHIEELDIPFDDKAHIIYVNGEYADDSPIGKLMHDFKCKNPNDMYYKNLYERAHILKETEGGKDTMCKIMEDMLMENMIEVAFELLMLGTVSNEDIAKATKLPIEKVKELSEQLKKETA